MSKGNSNNFFQNIIDAIFGGNDPEAEKRKQLRNISRNLSKSKYSKFYKFQGNEALPPMGKFFFEIYKVIYPAQSMFQNMQNQNLLKNLAIDFYTTDEIRQIEESLSEENIQKLSKQIPINNLEEEAMKRLEQYSEFFTFDKISSIDNMYNQLLTMKDFCTFDFYFFVKKFHKGMREADFGTMPNFEKVNAEYIQGEIKDFISVAWALQTDADWTNCIKLLRTYKGVEPVTIQNWKKVLSRVQSLKSSGALEMMVKLIDSNPLAYVETSSTVQNIVEPHLEEVKNTAEKALKKLLDQEKASKTGDICGQLFGNTEIIPLKNYSDAWNATFKNKRLMLFNNTESLKYLKNFLIYIFKKDIREFYDLMLVRGQWVTQAMSTPFSEAYNELLSVSDKITTFDDELAEEGAIGIKIKTLLPKTDRDASSKNIVNRFINDANTTAYEYIVNCTRNLITMGKIVKNLVEDYAKQSPTIITNWKELEKFSETPLKEFCVNIYKKIYLFTTLVKTTITPMNEE